MIVPTVYGEVRISGIHAYSRLEFRSHNSWGTVCSAGFDANAALVACQQLGYESGNYHTQNYYLE